MCYSEFGEIVEHIARMDADVLSIEASRSGMDLLDAFAERLPEPDRPRRLRHPLAARCPASDEIEALLARAERQIPRERLWVNPDCGLKTRTWEEVLPALEHLVTAARRRAAERAGGGGERGRSARARRHQSRFGDQGDPERLMDPVAELAGQRDELRGRRSPAVDQRQRVLGRDARRARCRSRVRSRPARSTMPPRSSLARRAPASSVPPPLAEPRDDATLERREIRGSRTGLVKNEPALTESGSAASTTMPLPRRSASTASRTSASGARSPTARPSSAASCP